MGVFLQARFPNLAAASCVRVAQSAGECLFVPSEWHHFVLNLNDTLSVNHNWFNGACDALWRAQEQSGLFELRTRDQDWRTAERLERERERETYAFFIVRMCCVHSCTRLF